MNTLDAIYNPMAELEHAAFLMCACENNHTWTLEELDRLRRVVSNLDAVGGRVERKMK